MRNSKTITLILSVITSVITASPNDEINNFSGISIDFSGIQGIDYAEEYMYHDVLATDRRVVYIKDSTTINFQHNELNMLAQGPRGYYDIVGINGPDGIANSGDEGLIRFKVDYDFHKETRYSDNNYNLYPIAHQPISFDKLTYPNSSIPVLGSTGHSTGDFSDTNAFHKGLKGPFGDEWHTIAFWDDDQETLEPLDKKTEYWASDGKEIVFVVNPKTPAMQIWTEGDAQFYTTPAKTYGIPKIHEQTTYIAEKGGSVKLQLIDINGKNIHYRITKDPKETTTNFIDTKANSYTLNHSDFSQGTQYLQYYYEGNAEFTKTRVITRNPSHPSLREDHGSFMGGNLAEGKAALKQRTQRTPYKWGYVRLKGNNALQDYWDSSGRNGSRRWLYKENPWGAAHPSGGGSAANNAFAALADGFTSKKGSMSRNTYGEYARQMLIGSNWFRVDPIGWEILHSSGAHPSTEVIGAGYYVNNMIIDSIIAYDILVGYFRDDQIKNGITAVEDLYSRDNLARYFVMAHTEKMGSGEGGLWDTAKLSGAMMVAMCLTEYDTPYYGASGYGSATKGSDYAPYIGSDRTWREILFSTPEGGFRGYPDQGSRINPESSELWQADGNWGGPNLGYFSLMINSFCVILNMTEMYEPQQYPTLRAGLERAIIGELHPLWSNKPAKYNLPLLVNKNFPILGQSAFNEIQSGGSAGLDGSSILNYIWYNDTQFDGSQRTSIPQDPSSLKTN